MQGNSGSIPDEALALVAGRFRILGEPTRLRILRALRDRERSVGQLVCEIGSGQANISKHLGLMLEAGILSRRRSGLEALYRVADPTVLELCDLVCSGIRRRLAAQQHSVRLFGRH